MTIAYVGEKQRSAAASDQPTPALPANRDARPQKITTTKSGKIIHEEISDMKGRVTERWFDGPTQYIKAPGAKEWEELKPGSSGGKPDLRYAPPPANGFPEIDWLSADNYAGSLKIGSSACLVFTPGGEQALDLRKPEKVKTMWQDFLLIACIESRSRLPAMVRYRDEIRAYTWGPAPSSPLALPADLIAQMKKKKDEIAQPSKQAAPPISSPNE